MPTLIVWGRRDRIITAEHGAKAHEGMPGSRLEVFEGSGHFPHLDRPLRFARLLSGFVAGTDGARLDTKMMRELVLERDEETAATLKRLKRRHAATAKA
jgi:hypothetical protein